MTKKSLYRQFLTSLFSMLLVLLLTIVGCYRIVVNHWNRQNLVQVETALNETANQLTREIERISNIGTAISSSTDIYRFMSGTPVKRMENLNSIRFLLTTCLNTNENISHAYLITHDQSVITAYPDVRQDVSAQTAKEIYLQHFLHSPDINVPFRGVRILPYITSKDMLFYAVMTPVYPSPSQTSDTEYLGVLVLMCKVERLRDMLNPSQDVSILLSFGNTCLNASDENIRSAWLSGERDGMHTQNVRNTDWIVWVCGNEDNARIASFQKMCLLFALCTTAVFCMLIFILYRKVITPIRELERQSIAVSTAEAANITYRSHLLELDSLACSIDRMLHSQRKMADEVLRLKTDMYESRILFLQSQINPHFLYNNFEMLRGMAGRGMMQEVLEATSCSAAIYRYCCRSSPEVSLQEEFGCIEQYAHLIMLCYRGAYQCSVTLDENTNDVTVPRMLLQPLVENSVLHGFIDHHRKQGTVYIRAHRHADKLELIVEDDGGGLADELIRQLNEEHAMSLQGKASRIGIQNVTRRLHLLYGETVSINFSRSGYGGLAIRILFHKPEKRTSPAEKTIRHNPF